jgi:DNA-binding CsgD family transcriptional regulator
MIALGKTNQEIGDALFIHASTVRTHVKKIHSKCDVKGRPRLAIAAYQACSKVEEKNGNTKD